MGKFRSWLSRKKKTPIECPTTGNASSDGISGKETPLPLHNPIQLLSNLKTDVLVTAREKKFVSPQSPKPVATQNEASAPSAVATQSRHGEGGTAPSILVQKAPQSPSTPKGNRPVALSGDKDNSPSPLRSIALQDHVPKSPSTPKSDIPVAATNNNVESLLSVTEKPKQRQHGQFMAKTAAAFGINLAPSPLPPSPKQKYTTVAGPIPHQRPAPATSPSDSSSPLAGSFPQPGSEFCVPIHKYTEEQKQSISVPQQPSQPSSNPNPPSSPLSESASIDGPSSNSVPSQPTSEICEDYPESKPNIPSPPPPTQSSSKHNPSSTSVANQVPPEICEYGWKFLPDPLPTQSKSKPEYPSSAVRSQSTSEPGSSSTPVHKGIPMRNYSSSPQSPQSEVSSSSPPLLAQPASKPNPSSNPAPEEPASKPHPPSPTPSPFEIRAPAPYHSVVPVQDHEPSLKTRKPTPPPPPPRPDPPILKISPELHLAIADYLEWPSTIMLKVTCKKLYNNIPIPTTQPTTSQKRLVLERFPSTRTFDGDRNPPYLCSDCMMWHTFEHMVIYPAPRPEFRFYSYDHFKRQQRRVCVRYAVKNPNTLIKGTLWRPGQHLDHKYQLCEVCKTPSRWTKRHRKQCQWNCEMCEKCTDRKNFTAHCSRCWMSDVGSMMVYEGPKQDPSLQPLGSMWSGERRAKSCPLCLGYIGYSAGNEGCRCVQEKHNATPKMSYD